VVVVDTSETLAVLFQEEEAARFARLIETASSALISAVNLLEVVVVLRGRTRGVDSEAKWDAFTRAAGLVVEPVTLLQAGWCGAWTWCPAPRVPLRARGMGVDHARYKTNPRSPMDSIHSLSGCGGQSLLAFPGALARGGAWRSSLTGLRVPRSILGRALDGKGSEG
jgi:hypothetical protein